MLHLLQLSPSSHDRSLDHNLSVRKDGRKRKYTHGSAVRPTSTLVLACGLMRSKQGRSPVRHLSKEGAGMMRCSPLGHLGSSAVVRTTRRGRACPVTAL